MRKIVAFLLLVGCCQMAIAGPWLMPGNMAIKSDVDLLADYGVITAPVLSWPIAWKNIGPALEANSSKIKSLPPAAQGAYKRLLALYKQQTQQHKLKSTISSSAGSKINPFPTFSARPRADFISGYSTEYMSRHFAGNLSVSYGAYDDTSKNVHLNGSYLAYLFNNWSIGVDKVNHWWGPGYSDNMIRTMNAAPIPEITLQRLQADPFQSHWLSWLGPWTFSTSLSKLGPDRSYPRPMAWFTNITIRPFSSLQLGFTRDVIVATPKNFITLGRIIIAKDNCKSAHPDSCKNYPGPGTEHNNISVRWNLYQVWKIPVSLYLDTSFDDHVKSKELPPFTSIIPIPKRTVFLFGANTWKQTQLGLLRVYFEYEYNTPNLYYLWGSRQQNFYTWGRYPYTYYNSLIASPLGNESVGYSLGAILNENMRTSDTFTLRLLRINPYNRKISIGYPYAKQSVIWSAVGRHFALPHQWGKLSTQIGYLYAIQSGKNRLDSSPSVFVTWQKQLG